LASQGSVIITTRNRSLAFEPAGKGIEVLHFDSEAGSGFLLHLLQMDVAKDIANQDVRSAKALSEKLSGHALALNQMAGLIHKRSWSIDEFLRIYDKNARRIHGLSQEENSIDTVWRLSFESLDGPASAILGVLSFYMPDSIPEALFRRTSSKDLPHSLKFCEDDFEYVDKIVNSNANA
jgi:hypothetical protein